MLLLCCAAAETGGRQRRIFSTIVRPEQNPLWQRRATKPHSSSFTKNHTMFWLNYAPDQICAPPVPSEDKALPIRNINMSWLEGWMNLQENSNRLIVLSSIPIRNAWLTKCWYP